MLQFHGDALAPTRKEVELGGHLSLPTRPRDRRESLRLPCQPEHRAKGPGRYRRSQRLSNHEAVRCSLLLFDAFGLEVARCTLAYPLNGAFPEQALHDWWSSYAPLRTWRASSRSSQLPERAESPLRSFGFKSTSSMSRSASRALVGREPSFRDRQGLEDHQGDVLLVLRQDGQDCSRR